ncbi:MAG: Protein-L-isoaspartate(D-aspartate) O-methyltransferase [Deltaproteobacteria bacterium]|nr:Protein-L-isoaspartate(D-aspartate) O-methyltransferase [Deltaproteobacteria bacterium]
MADLGAGGGYFTWYLAAAVGPQGKVYAVEIDDTALAIIEKEMSLWISCLAAIPTIIWKIA